jgi:hypothetical protein
MLRRQIQPTVTRLTAVAFSFYMLGSARLASGHRCPAG